MGLIVLLQDTQKFMGANNTLPGKKQTIKPVTCVSKLTEENFLKFGM